MESTHTLKTGERLDVTTLGPGEGRGDTAANREVWWFAIQPFDPWTSPGENELMARALRGAADDSLHDYLIVGRIDGEIVGTVWHGTSSNTREVGGYGFVRTDPAHRGKGVAQDPHEALGRAILGGRRPRDLSGHGRPGRRPRL